MVASALLKNTVFIEEWLAATTFVKQRNTVIWKTLFSSIKSSNYKEKMFLGKTALDHSLSLIFLYICQ